MDSDYNATEFEDNRFRTIMGGFALDQMENNPEGSFAQKVFELIEAYKVERSMRGDVNLVDVAYFLGYDPLDGDGYIIDAAHFYLSKREI